MRLMRIQDKRGLGPFRSLDVVEVMRETAPTPFYHAKLPTPSEEGLLTAYEPHHRCACATPRQLVTWFPSRMRKALKKCGYQVVLIEVPDESVLIGEMQVVYDTRYQA